MSDIASQQPQTNHRVLVAVVIGLGVLFVIAVVVSIVLAVTRHAPAHAAAEAFSLPPGAAVVAMQSQQNRLILHVRSPAGDEIDIVDTADGHLVARIR